MAPAAANPQSQAKTKKEKEREKREKAAQQQTERLKVVVRRLPPNLPEDIFWQTVQTWVSEETATWKVFYPGKFKKRDNKENIPSRAYVAFKNDLALAKFSQEFDGHLFRDKAGNESYAIVEFAPYQKVPPEKKKTDNKNATIEKDEDYISFIQSLNTPTNAEPVTVDSLLAATRPPSPPKTTPLLEALKAEKSAQKDKEAILRNHAHYKDQANVAALNGVAGSSRKEEKKKAAAQAQAAKQPTAPPTPGKKGKKAAKEAAQKPPAPPNKGAPVQEVKGANPSGSSAPKQPRQPKQPKAAATASNATPAPAAKVTIAQPPKAAPATAPPPEAASGKPAAEPAAPAEPAAAAASARRMRPLFSGRQFEAALAGVGARPKRERPEGNTPVSPTQPQAVSSNTEAAPPSGSSESKEQNPTASPPRSRNRRGGAPPAAPNPAGAKAAPTVIQRDPETNGTGSPKAAGTSLPPSAAPATTGPSERGGRGARRGRGRGGGAARGASRGG